MSLSVQSSNMSIIDTSGYFVNFALLSNGLSVLFLVCEDEFGTV